MNLGGSCNSGAPSLSLLPVSEEPFPLPGARRSPKECDDKMIIKGSHGNLFFPVSVLQMFVIMVIRQFFVGLVWGSHTVLFRGYSWQGSGESYATPRINLGLAVSKVGAILRCAVSLV